MVDDLTRANLGQEIKSKVYPYDACALQLPVASPTTQSANRDMKVSLALLGALALTNAVPVVEKRLDISAVFDSNHLSGSFVTLLKDVADAIKHFSHKEQKLIPAKSSFTSWKTFKANGVNLGGWLGTRHQPQLSLQPLISSDSSREGHRPVILQ